MDKRKRSRIITTLLVALLAASTISAVSYSAGISLGVRDTSLYEYVPSLSMEGTVGDFEMGVNFGGKTWIDAGAYYNGHAGKTFRYEIGTGLHQVYSTGGMWGLTFDCGQEFNLADHWNIRYMLGVQLGLSWSPYSPENVQLSESPYVEFEAGYYNDVFTGKIYWVGDKLYERTWQSLPIIGAYMSFDITPNHQIYIDSYFKMADYMRQPDILISATETRIGYRYMGGNN